jgi:DNA-binding NtrC family response regulator
LRKADQIVTIAKREGHNMENEAGNTTMKILVVDDDDFFLDGFDKILQSPSAEVKTVDSGNAALQEIGTSQYHLCFLDIFLPDLNGIEVLKRIKETSPLTKVIAMTAGVVTSSMQATIEKDAYMFIAKPFDVLQVKMLTRRILEEST